MAAMFKMENGEIVAPNGQAITREFSRWRVEHSADSLAMLCFEADVLPQGLSEDDRSASVGLIVESPGSVLLPDSRFNIAPFCFRVTIEHRPIDEMTFNSPVDPMLMMRRTVRIEAPLDMGYKDQQGLSEDRREQIPGGMLANEVVEERLDGAMAAGRRSIVEFIFDQEEVELEFDDDPPWG